MNTIKVYKTDGTLKYTFLPSSASTQVADGHISSQSCYMASDDTGAELEGGSCDFEVLSQKVLEFSKGEKIKYYSGGELFGVFFVETSERTAETRWHVTGIDSIAMLENACYYGVFVTDAPLEKYISDNLQDNLNIPVTVDSALSDFKVTASYPSGYNDTNSDVSPGNEKTTPTQKSSMRELFQMMAFGYGFRFDTLKNEGVKIIPDPITYNVAKIYTVNDIYSDAAVTEKSNDVGIINLYRQYLNVDPQTGAVKHVKGYFPINGGAKTKIDPFTASPALSREFEANGIKQQAENDLTGNVNPKKQVDSIITLDTDGIGSDIFPDGKITTAHYFTAIQNYDGSFTYQIDLAKLAEVEDYFSTNYPSQTIAETTYTDESGIKYALGNIGWREVFVPTSVEGALPYTFEHKKTIIYDKNKAKNNVVLPFFSDDTANRVDVYFGRTKEVSFKVKYSGEKLGDIVSIPAIWGKSYYCAIKSMDFTFSASNVFCNIVADVLSPDEEKKIVLPNVYGSAKYGTAKYM